MKSSKRNLLVLTSGLLTAAPSQGACTGSGVSCTVDEIEPFLIVGFKRQSEGFAVNLQNGEYGADREVLSRGGQSPTDASFPTMNSNFDQRWAPQGNERHLKFPYTNNVHAPYEGIDYSGHIAITSDTGGITMSNTDIFGDLQGYKIGFDDIAVVSANPRDPGASEYESMDAQTSQASYFNDGRGETNPLGGVSGIPANGFANGVNLDGLTAELEAWKTTIEGATGEGTITYNIEEKSYKASGSSARGPFVIELVPQDGSAVYSHAGSNYWDSFTDTNGDGIVMIDVNRGGNDWEINNADVFIVGPPEITAIFRVNGEANMNMASSSIQRIIHENNGAKTAEGGPTVLFFKGDSEGGGSGDAVFAGNNVVYNRIAFWELNEGTDDGGKNEIDIQNGQGCAQFIGSTVLHTSTSRFNKCTFAGAPSSTSSSGPVPTCADQESCIKWETRTVPSSSCVGGGCAVEVCMVLDLDNCAKGSGGGGLSHVCDGADSSGCPRSTSGSTVFDTGDGGSCPAGDYKLNTKCEGADSGFKMCQEGAPGEKLYWTLKDGQNSGAVTPLIRNAESACEPTITCRRSDDEGVGNCGGNQDEKEMVWTYTIPTQESCHGCGAPPPPTCASTYTLSGPSSITTDAPHPYPCAATMTYNQFPDTSMIKLYAENPSGTDEFLAETDAVNDMPPNEASNHQFTKNFQMSCQGNDLHGPNGPVTLGANGQQVNLYTVGPCGVSNLTPVKCNNNVGGGANGDPHVKTWRNRHFDYNGECDLVLISSHVFGDGLGLDLHIRTTARRQMSYISSAALRIGEDILEIQSKGVYSVNGKVKAPMPTKLAGAYTVTYTAPDDKTIHQHIFEVKLADQHERLVFKVYRDFVSVVVDKATPASFGDAHGLMGDFSTGHLVARDGLTVMEDIDTFGQEWQVTDEEPQLFRDKTRFPQYPAACHMPSDEVLQQRRRLAEADTSLLEAAQDACSKYQGDAIADCVYDVTTTGDLVMADAGAY